MYRIFSTRVVFGLIAWLALSLYILGQFLSQVSPWPVGTDAGHFFTWVDRAWHSLAGDISSKLSRPAIPALVWLLPNLLLCNPVWRRVWRMFPFLNTIIFPDLNGEWDVELRSNWPRHLQILEAAQSNATSFDMRQCAISELAPLTPMILRAQIYQTWWKIEMRLFNPAANSPIKRSDAINVEPFKRQGLQPAGISYFYKQQNQSGDLSDDIEFSGAARLELDANNDILTGIFWTARMWARAMNTGGEIKFSRRII